MNLEVIITHKGRVYEAKCPTYPHCSGVGKSTDEAMYHLKQSIGRQIRRDSEKELDKLFSKDNFTDVIHMSGEKDKHEHRIYSLSNTDVPYLKNIQLKLDECPELKYLPKNVSHTSSIKDLFDSLRSESVPASDIPLKESAISILDNPLKSKDDGFIFGIPLSLN